MFCDRTLDFRTLFFIKSDSIVARTGFDFGTNTSGVDTFSKKTIIERQTPLICRSTNSSWSSSSSSPRRGVTSSGFSVRILFHLVHLSHLFTNTKIHRQFHMFLLSIFTVKVIIFISQQSGLEPWGSPGLSFFSPCNFLGILLLYGFCALSSPCRSSKCFLTCGPPQDVPIVRPELYVQDMA